MSLVNGTDFEDSGTEGFEGATVLKGRNAPKIFLTLETIDDLDPNMRGTASFSLLSDFWDRGFIG